MKRSLMGRAGWVLTDERRIEGHNLCGFEKAPLLPFRVIKTWDAHELEHYGIAAEGSGKCALTEKKYLWKCVNLSSFGAFYFCRCMNRNVIKPSMDFLIYFFVNDDVLWKHWNIQCGTNHILHLFVFCYLYRGGGLYRNWVSRGFPTFLLQTQDFKNWLEIHTNLHKANLMFYLYVHTFHKLGSVGLIHETFVTIEVNSE